VHRCLFVGIRQLDQLRFRPWPTVECYTHWERAAARVPHRHIDCWETRYRREHLAIVAGRRIQILISGGGLLHVGYTKASSFSRSIVFTTVSRNCSR
jgi:hypothetical protein